MGDYSMRRRKPFEGEITDIIRTMKQSKDSSHFRRIQCVYLSMLNPHMTNEEIGAATLFTARNVIYIHARYREKGLSGLEDGRGGRYRENLTIAQEEEFLKPFEEQGKTGSLGVAGEVKKAYEEKVGKEVAESTIYRLLDRHGFRKIVPYKRHKKADTEEQKVFKKTSSVL
jgi:transposase